MKFQFHVDVRTTSLQEERWTEVTIGRVRLMFTRPGNATKAFLVAVRNDTRACYIQDYPSLVQSDVLQYWCGKTQEVELVEYQTLLFNLNQMLAEQGLATIEPIIDKAFSEDQCG